LGHRNASVFGHGKQLLLRSLNGAFRSANQAEKVPRRILDILRIDLLMELKLLSPFLVFTRVITGDAALPMIGGVLWPQFQLSIEIRQSFGDASTTKMLLAPAVKHAGGEIARSLPRRCILVP